MSNASRMLRSEERALEQFANDTPAQRHANVNRWGFNVPEASTLAKEILAVMEPIRRRQLEDIFGDEKSGTDRIGGK